MEDVGMILTPKKWPIEKVRTWQYSIIKVFFFFFLELDCSTFDVKHLLLHLKSPICSFYSLLQINPRW